MRTIQPQGRKDFNFRDEKGTNNLRAFVTGSITSDSRHISRISKYFLYWNFYRGEHWRQFNETMLAFNYSKAFVDKVINFLLGKDGFSFRVSRFDSDVIDKEEERVIEKFFLKEWRRNNLYHTLHEMLLMGSVCGDCWVTTEWETASNKVKITTADSRYCFPEYDKTGKLTEMEFRFPLEKNEENYLLRCVKYSDKHFETWFQKSSGTYPVSDRKNRFGATKEANTYGFIPVVHIKNRPSPDSKYSQSDLTDIMKLNKIYNEIAIEVKSVIDYHTAPTTVITGASVNQLQRGIGTIWSGLPAEANVFTLGLDADISSTLGFMELIKKAMHELSDVPENSLGQMQPISNTSAAALQITYQPLIQQANLKWLMYGTGITTINNHIYQIRKLFDPVSVAELPVKFVEEYFSEPVFGYSFPRDRMVDIQMANQEIQLGIGGRREWMEKMGKNNIPDLLDEIREERLSEGELQSEIMQLSSGFGEEFGGGEGGEDELPTTKVAEKQELDDMRGKLDKFVKK